MTRLLTIAVLIAMLIATGVYSALPHPIRDQAILREVAKEGRYLLATENRRPTQRVLEIPAERWPPAISSLKPYSVTIIGEMVDITIRPSFDGGWGYGVANEHQNLTMPPKCWAELHHDVYWHGPC